ncbi:DNA-binding transcriptional regulator [Celeribacter neptunius]|uniref:Transcriptional regulator, IclR family n=1 Tax=Celeribacter neptunius TaxID=588602 RepID=A0A1I3NEG7_9RHOB|nr:DNA-binding transcriptional regulator [Celeribacter neptunius]SFJ07575.1 transcriptional regulator, IclR family [Celeribacter neptunius]
MKAPPKGSVRALARGLSILRYVNKLGETRPGEIAKALALPRPTVYRLLETLEELGYVTFSATSNYVRVTRLAAALGDGYALTSEMSQTAGPLFAKYGRSMVWPLDLTVYNNAAMVIQETTHGRSPLSIDRGMTGYRLPVLRTSAGRAYLAFCPEEERGLILEHLRRLGDEQDLPYLEERWLNRLISEIRARGVAIRDSGEFNPQTSSIAVPIRAPDARSSETVLGCVSMIWIRTAMNTKKALEDYAEPLKEIAARIGGSLSD